MRVICNGEERPAMAATLDGQLNFRAPAGEVSGYVLAPEDATQDHLARERITCGIIVALIWTGAVVALLAVEPAARFSDGAVLAFALVATAVFVAVYLYRRSQWFAELGPRVAASLPPGTPVGVEANGLKIGERRHPWDRVTVEAVGVNSAVDGDGGITTILWLTIDAEGARATVDSQLTSEGWRITGEIWRRARRP